MAYTASSILLLCLFRVCTSFIPVSENSTTRSFYRIVGGLVRPLLGPLFRPYMTSAASFSSVSFEPVCRYVVGIDSPSQKYKSTSLSMEMWYVSSVSGIYYVITAGFRRSRLLRSFRLVTVTPVAVNVREDERLLLLHLLLVRTETLSGKFLFSIALSSDPQGF